MFQLQTAFLDVFSARFLTAVSISLLDETPFCMCVDLIYLIEKILSSFNYSFRNCEGRSAGTFERP